MTAISVAVGESASSLEHEASSLLLHRLEQRGAQAAAEEAAVVVVGTPSSSSRIAALVADGTIADLEGVGPEGYVLLPLGSAEIVLAANAERGVLYGVGRLLREATTPSGGWQPPAAEIRDWPRLAFRNIYFADHMGNWYSHATEADVFEYLEEMALWGYNELMTTLAVQAGETFADAVERVRRLEERARGLGMIAGPVIQSNTPFVGPAPEHKATPVPIPGSYDVCPSQPGAVEFLVDDKRTYLAMMEPFDFICFWPYDGGGCACDQCRPWSGTYIDLSEAIARDALSGNPEVWVSAWFFERWQQPEDQALFDRLAGEPDWFRRIVAGIDEARRWVDQGRKVPGRYEVMLFPDISMFDGIPWGGRGANPAPRRWAAELADTRSLVSGAVVYSEGRYDDLNKIVWAGLLWDPDRPVAEIVREYCTYYFGAGVADDATALVHEMEAAMEGLPDNIRWERGVFHAELGARGASVGEQLAAEVRRSWRWQLIEAKCTIEATYAALQDPDAPERKTLVDRLRTVYEEVRDVVNLHDRERSLPTWFWAPLEEAFPKAGETRAGWTYQQKAAGSDIVVFQQAKDDLDTRGFAVIPDFLTADQVAAGRAELARLFPSPEERAADPGRYESLTGGQFAGLVDFPWAGAALNDAATGGRLVGLARYVIGVDDVRMIQGRAWAKYGGTVDFDQALHVDYPNHTLVVPREHDAHREVIAFLYYSDVDETSGPTYLVSKEHTAAVPAGITTLEREEHGDIYANEVPAVGPAGTLVLYTPSTFHRGSKLGEPPAFRWIVGTAYRAAGLDWMGHQAWPFAAGRDEMARFLTRASVEQRSVLGFPAPGDPYWTAATLAGVAARYPGIDLSAYAVGVDSAG